MATSITARRAGQGTSVLDISGDITAGSEAALMSAYGEATGAKTVLLNFARLEYTISDCRFWIVDCRARHPNELWRQRVCGPLNSSWYT